MNQQCELSPPQTKPPRSFSNTRLANLRQYISCRRYWLGLLAGVLFLVMIVGIIFAAHQYYVDFGGQGWIKVREEKEKSNMDHIQQLYLPLRQIEVRERHQQSSWVRRSAGSDIPFYTCGDQQNSCETFEQPNICCPVGMACYATKHSPSGIFCCNATASAFQCQATENQPPQCMTSTVECGIEMGGGCCPSELECSPNGCIDITDQTLVGNSTTSSSTVSNEIAASTSNLPASVSASRTNSVILTRTVTEYPPATQTLPKGGEIAQLGAASTQSIVVALYLPYPVWVIVCLAGLMGLL